MTYPTAPEEAPTPPPPPPDIEVRMLWDLGGYHKGDVILVPADIADLYVLAGYVELVEAAP